MRKQSLSLFLTVAILTLAMPAQAQISLPRLEAPKEETPEFLKDETDYSRLSEAEEKSARLDKLFEKLAVEEDEGQAELIAEEVWALWTCLLYTSPSPRD